MQGPPPIQKMTELKNTYTTREVAAMTGLTARQLQWWDARKIIKPSVATHRTEAGGYTERRYSPVDLFELAVLADLILDNREDPVLAATSPQRFGEY